MWRIVHSWVGLVGALLVLVIALSGAMLATKPSYDRFFVQDLPNDMSVAQVLEKIAKKQKRIQPEKIKIAPSGEVKLTFKKGGKSNEQILIAQTGELKRLRKEPAFYVWMRDFHRSFLLGDKGRIVPAIAGVLMFLLTVSGLFLLFRRLGGIGKFFSPMSWRGIGASHSALGRLSLLPLLVIIITALWLSGITYKLVPTGKEKPPFYPQTVEKLKPVKSWELIGLKEIPFNSVKQIIFPLPNDWTDVWTIETNDSYVFVDQFTGKVLSKQPLNFMAKAYDWVVLLHTAEGAYVWGILLFFSSMSVPYFAISGAVLWVRNRKLGGGKIANQSSASSAGVLILVASENGSTWGFAKALHKGLVEKGEKVRTISINAWVGNYPNLKIILPLVATYGDGDAPQTAKRFDARLKSFNPKNSLNFAVLAFGDCAFPKFCAFGEKVDRQFNQKFGASLLPIVKIDKQSGQAFSAWCRQIGDLLGHDLSVEYVPNRPKTIALQLQNKRLCAQETDSPVAILRFVGKKIPNHQSGDWLAVYPENCNVPRLYSLGSNSLLDRAVEICVRYQKGGLCSPWLCGLSEKDTIEVSIIKNPLFHLPKSKPVIMIGAGTGIAPFVGMIRHNHKKQPLHLFYGGRNPSVDNFYEQEIEQWLSDKRLTNFYSAWSRVGKKQYIQDVIAENSELLAQLLKQDATIMICGGRQMAESVLQKIDKTAQAIGTNIENLKNKKRLLEDVY